MAAHHPQSYPVMTSSQYSHSSTLLDNPAMNVDLDKSTHEFNHISPPSSSGSSQSSMLYGAEHLNFAATPGAASFAHQSSTYADGHHHSPTQHVHNESHSLSLDPTHLRNTAVGPSRVLTRRQARAAQQQQATVHGPAGDNEGHANLHNTYEDGFIFPGADPSRAQTPNRFRAGAHFVDQHPNITELSIGTTTLNLHHAAMSPPHPGTPASVTSSSNFSTYGFHPYATHSRSTSSSTFPRSASPAMSVMSAATSLSSHSCRPRPPLSSGNSFPTTSKPKKRLVNRERKEICQFYIDNPTVRQEDIAARWGVERSTVSKILKHKNKWLAIPEGEDQQVAKHRPSKFPEIEEVLRDWLSECRTKKQLIQDIAIRQKAREVAREMKIGEDKFKASAGWVENFKHRHGIKKGIWVGRAEPAVIMDDDSESDGETLSEVRERVDRDRALRQAAMDAIREKEAVAAAQRQTPQDQLRDNVVMDVTSTVVNQTTQPSQPTVDEQKVAPTSADHWPPPVISATPDDLMPFSDANVVNGHGGNDITPRPQSSEEQRQQLSLDCQPPPPYQSDLSQIDNSTHQSLNTLSIQSMAEAIPHYPASQMSLQSQHLTFTPTQAWSAARATVQDPVTAQEANLAIEKVLLFLKAQQPGYVRPEELNVITDVKHMIWLSAATSHHTSPTVSINTAVNQPQNAPKSS